MKKLTKTVLLVLALVMLLSAFSSCSEKEEINLGGGTIEQEFNEESRLEDIVSTIPTKEGAEFAGWYSDQKYADYIDPSCVTKDQIRKGTAYAKWIVVKDVNYSVRAEECTITDSGRKKQKMDQVVISTEFDIIDLKRAGYTALQFDVSLEVREIDNANSYVFLYKNKECNASSGSLADAFDKYVLGNDKNDPSLLYTHMFQYGGKEHKNTEWGMEKFSATIPLEELEKDLYIRYGASGNNDDDWCNRNICVYVTAIK